MDRDPLASQWIAVVSELTALVVAFHLMRIRSAFIFPPLAMAFVVLSLMVIFPYPIAPRPTSTVLNDRDGGLLSASIAADGQWRFPLTDSVPHKLEACLLVFEDEHFYHHPGVNPVSIMRAIFQNLQAGRVVSGASTLTMQLARMLRHEDRTYWQKVVEVGLAMRLEFNEEKKTILRQYASLAPFGGNVVGIDAASWRYYGRPAYLLSWAESATLAVLPNQPGAIYPGSSSVTLKHKRDFVLRKLYARGLMDSLSLELSLAEPLPGKPYDIPQKATHLLTTSRTVSEGEQVPTTLSAFWQEKANEIVERKHRILKTNGVDNLAVIVVDLNTGKVLAYVGNTSDTEADGWQVDIIQRPRSSGSILKPVLYALALDDGLILPETMLPDVPSFFGGYTPKNFNLGYEGMIKASQALSMSLNIPFAHLLKDYKYERFHQALKNFGITTLNRHPGHYGLSLILGGGEVKLWDLAQVYFSCYRRLSQEENRTITCVGEPQQREDLPVEPINIWQTFKAMTELSRPGVDQNWQNFSSSQRIAWKTGTSFGFRDAWAVGLNGEILVGVWVGNADGEGRAGLVGSSSAGPILTELMRLSDYEPSWLENLQPFAHAVETCAISGMLAAPDCPVRKITMVGIQGEKSGLCPYHQKKWVDEAGQYLVNRSCYDMEKAHDQVFFILPPKEGYYYQKNHSDYVGVPSLFPGCAVAQDHVLTINYPEENARIFIPREIQGDKSEVILEASHQNAGVELFWHLNETYLGSTVGEHKQSLTLPKGRYTVTIMDSEGNSYSRNFEVLSEQ